jgi:hypothetical protein
MPQLTYSQNAIIAQPGMAYDAEVSNRDVVSVIAAETIPFGSYCELNSNGLAQVMQDSTTGGTFAADVEPIGICLFDPLGVEQAYTQFSVPPTTTGSAATGYLKGMSVPFMRKGRIWVLGDASGTATRYGAINVHHSSTGANPQGVFTFLPVSATPGNEIDIAPGCTVWNPNLYQGTSGISSTDPFGNVFQVYPVEINL